MRILNTDMENGKRFSRFSLPGFRSGSTVKKIIACAYYLFVFINIIVNGVLTAFDCEFQGGMDIALYFIFWLCAVGAYLSPVIIVGLSDYYDLHGIKLVLAVVSAMCVFMTCSMYVSSFFSDELKGMNPELDASVSENADSGEEQTTPELENELIEEHIENNKKDNTDSTSGSDAQ